MVFIINTERLVVKIHKITIKIKSENTISGREIYTILSLRFPDADISIKEDPILQDESCGTQCFFGKTIKNQ